RAGDGGGLDVAYRHLAGGVRVRLLHLLALPAYRRLSSAAPGPAARNRPARPSGRRDRRRSPYLSRLRQWRLAGTLGGAGGGAWLLSGLQPGPAQQDRQLDRPRGSGPLHASPSDRSDRLGPLAGG